MKWLVLKMRKPTQQQINTEFSLQKIFSGGHFDSVILDKHEGQDNTYCLHFTMIQLPGYGKEREAIFYINEPGRIFDIKIIEHDTPVPWLR